MHSGRKEKALDDFQILRTLGRGNYGKVVLARHRQTGELRALKILDHSKVAEDERASSLETYRAELRALEGVSHPNVIKFYSLVEKGCYRSGDKTRAVSYVAMEFCAGGELFELLATSGALSENAARWFFRQLLSGLTHLASLNLAHRDLKPENLLLADQLALKIADFGFATRLADGQLADTYLGSEGYMAPEFHKKPLSYRPEKVDVFAAGVVLFNMVTGLPPFRKTSPGCQLFELLNKKDKGYWDNYEKRIKKSLSTEFRNLIYGMLDPNPDTRFSLAEVAQASWVVSHLDEEAAVKEVQNFVAASSSPIESFAIGHEVNSGNLTVAPARSTQNQTESGSSKLYLELSCKEQISGVRVITESIESTLDQIIENLQLEDEAIKIERTEKGKILIRKGPTQGRLAIAITSKPNEYAFRVVMGCGDYQDLHEIKKGIFDAIKKLA